MNTSSPAIAKVTTAPAKALQEIVKRQVSGRLTVSDPSDDAILWRVYLGNGQVHFATNLQGQRERLNYFLPRLAPQLDRSQLTEFPSDYQFLCHHWQSGQLSLQQVRQILFTLAQEACVQLLALPQGELSFERTIGLDPILLSLPLQQLVLPVREAIGQWSQLRSAIASPLKRPQILDAAQLAQYLQANTDRIPQLQPLAAVLEQNLCLYEVAAHLKIDVLELAHHLQLLTHIGVIGTNPYRIPEVDNRPVVACIDDSKTVQRNVRLLLEAAGYRVVGLMEPMRALTTLVRDQPSLILMDISMPDIDGYELCRLLRQSTLLKEVPIVMLTGREGLVDRFRARMVGANSYITKPFDSQELLTLVHKFTRCSPLEVS
ncbi:regulator [Neosynechococcus sphagnicola sy1]|uniref:Regulator n=1 Tax=Neosynechococcus sphagnicola sy1 TaxID=1497020 RepID=A0A098TJS5_9CYAN|nr:response regulator [Neosynechococcus sphagnicola]KGF72082.1 regulator [Neosynechococcus sphagnicola sy1]